MQFTAVQEQPDVAKNEVFCGLHREMYCLGCNRRVCTPRPGASRESVVGQNPGNPTNWQSNSAESRNPTMRQNSSANSVDFGRSNAAQLRGGLPYVLESRYEETLHPYPPALLTLELLKHGTWRTRYSCDQSAHGLVQVGGGWVGDVPRGIRRKMPRCIRFEPPMKHSYN